MNFRCWTVAPNRGSCRRMARITAGFSPACFSMARSASEAATAPCCRVSPDRINRPRLARTTRTNSPSCLAPIWPASSTITTASAAICFSSKKRASVSARSPSACKSCTCCRCGAKTVTGRPAATRPRSTSFSAKLFPVPAPPRRSVMKSRLRKIFSTAAVCSDESADDG